MKWITRASHRYYMVRVKVLKGRSNMSKLSCCTILHQGCGSSLYQGYDTSLHPGYGTSLHQGCGTSLHQGYGTCLHQGCGICLHQGCGTSLHQGYGTHLYQRCGTSLHQGCGTSLHQGCCNLYQRCGGSGVYQGVWSYCCKTLFHTLHRPLADIMWHHKQFSIFQLEKLIVTSRYVGKRSCQSKGPLVASFWEGCVGLVPDSARCILLRLPQLLVGLCWPELRER